MDEDLLNSLMELVQEEPLLRSTGLRIGVLVSRVAEKGNRPEVIRRHILWLVKYGFLRVADLSAE